MPDLLAAIQSEATVAKRDPALLASFEALRLNLGTEDAEVATLLDAGLWRSIEGEVAIGGPPVWGMRSAIGGRGVLAGDRGAGVHLPPFLRSRPLPNKDFAMASAGFMSSAPGAGNAAYGRCRGAATGGPETFRPTVADRGRPLARGRATRSTRQRRRPAGGSGIPGDGFPGWCRGCPGFPPARARTVEWYRRPRSCFVRLWLRRGRSPIRQATPSSARGARAGAGCVLGTMQQQRLFWRWRWAFGSRPSRRDGRDTQGWWDERLVIDRADRCIGLALLARRRHLERLGLSKCKQSHGG